MIFVGTLFVALGVFWLLSNLGLISAEFWAIFWPVLLIAVGIKFALGHRKWQKFFGKPGEKKIKIE